MYFQVRSLTPETGMFKILTMLFHPDIAEKVADEVSYYIGVAARASDEFKYLRDEFTREREVVEAYRLRLDVFRCAGGTRSQWSPLA